VERQKGEASRPERAPFFALDFVGREYLEDKATGGQLTLVQRDQFLGLIKDPNLLDAYAKQGSTNEELVAIFELPLTAIEVFAPVLAKSRALLANRVRTQLLQAGDKGNETALTFLAKTYLEGEQRRNPTK
jgi:hypothetical protein